ncbi:MAG: DUF3109 family protein [Bacteroidetes bacterium]|nr:MAG: DUF3109 family protein [Bacteroidota bacterium]
MISLDKTLISDDLKEVYFCCDLEQCKGACCVEGDAGAPLEEEEIPLLEDYLDEISPFMTLAGRVEMERTGVFDYDAAGKFVTPLIQDRECAYIRFENGIARCAIEEAFQQGKIPFPKPLSCHLYPVRISDLGPDEAVNYHQWHICNKALEKGCREKLPLYLFLEEALIRKYGRNWFNRLVKLIR